MQMKSRWIGLLLASWLMLALSGSHFQISRVNNALVVRIILDEVKAQTWTPVVDDTFQRGPTSVGAGANSTTGVGQPTPTGPASSPWIDAVGNRYSINSSNILIDPTAAFGDGLQRPASENGISLRMDVTTDATVSSTAYYFLYLRGYALLLDFSNGHSAINTGVTINTPANFTPNYAHRYKISFYVYQSSPTTYSFTLTDVTTATVVTSASGTDNTAGIQVAGALQYATGNTGTTTASRIQTFSGSAAATGSIAASPQAVAVNSAGNILTLTGTSTTWTPGSVSQFSVTSGSASITTQSVASATSASLTLTGAMTQGANNVTISDGTNSFTLTTLTYGASNSVFAYSPFTWVQGAAGSGATTINSGAYCRTLYANSGTAVLYFDTSLKTPTYAMLNYQINKGGWTYTPSAASVTLSVPASRGPPTLLEFTMRSPGSGDRFDGHAGITFLGVLLDSGATLTTPPVYAKKVLVYGDSITEGIDARGNDFAQTSNDSTASWAFLLRDNVQAEVGQVGFSGMAVTNTTYCAKTLAQTYTNLYGTNARSLIGADLVIFGLGTNDGGNSGFAAGYDAVINAVKAAVPTAKTMIWQDFRAQTNAGEAQAASDTGSTLVTGLVGYMSATTDSLDNNHPTATAHATKMLSVLGGAARPLLYPASTISISNTFVPRRSR